MANLTKLQRRHNLGKLAQGNAGQCFIGAADTHQSDDTGRNGSCHADRYQLVHDILLGSLIGIVGLHLHLHVVVALPGSAYGDAIAVAEGHLQFHSLIGNAQTTGFLVVNLDTRRRERLEQVAAHQQQFGHPTHDTYETVTILCQLLQVIALQAYFHGYSHR